MKAVYVLLILASLSGCTRHVESARPAPQDTSGAVREMVIFVANQCKQKTGESVSDFKACASNELNEAVEQIKHFEKCFSESGCKPDASRFFSPEANTGQ